MSFGLPLPLPLPSRLRRASVAFPLPLFPFPVYASSSIDISESESTWMNLSSLSRRGGMAKLERRLALSGLQSDTGIEVTWFAS